VRRGTHERIQAFIRGLEEGLGAKLLKMSSALMGFVLLALWFNLCGFNGFSNPEAMESAHLGRQLAEGKGYTTDCIRPLALGLLQGADTNHAAEVLRHPVPDLSNAPGYPFLLAGLMKVLPFQFAADARHPWSYQPEFLIAGFNELLFFAAVLLLFQVARRLFDRGVAWVSAVIFAGTEIYWKFSVSGLSTIWLVVVFLALVWCLVALEEREHRAVLPSVAGSLALAAGAGCLVGIGGLSRYSFAWMIVPVLFFLRLFFDRQRGKLCLWAAISFLAVLGPWITRNLALSQTPFGTAGYALLENTPPLPEEQDRLERSLHPNAAGLSRLTPRDVVNKFLINEGEILGSDLPRLGGNWVCAFFLCGLFLPYRSPALRRFRFFLIWSLVLLAVAQALGQTHLSTDTPGINSENLLVLPAPLVLVFGTGVFYTLLDQISHPDPKFRKVVVVIFAGVMCLPLLLNLMGPPSQPVISPYSPAHVQKTAAMMKPDELMMSDIPWAVAWYGARPCLWLTLDDAGTFDEINHLKPVGAIYLTQRTTDRRFLSQMLANQQSWEYFMLNSLPAGFRGEAPGGFGARYGLIKESLDYLPDQTFISNSNRWQTGPEGEKKVE
jgi:4-amino-4-deoxy-L-arabinose transferase-like glycosyltransferase